LSPEQEKPQIVGLVALGLDSKDGHVRLTRAEDMLLLGGSQETHQAMQGVAIRFGESLRKRGKRLRDVSVDEVIDLLRGAREP
jgi:hypothetical protein